MKTLLFFIPLLFLFSFAHAEQGIFIPRSAETLSQPVDPLYYRASPNYNDLDIEVWGQEEVEVLGSTIDPSGKAFIKICKKADCQNSSKWTKYRNDLDEPVINGLNIRYEIDENGFRRHPIADSMPKYKQWEDLNLSQGIRDFYQNKPQYKEELRKQTDPTRYKKDDCLPEDSADALSELGRRALNQYDLFEGEKNYEELLAYIEHHQAGLHNCGLGSEGKAYRDYLNKYKDYINTAGDHFFQNGGNLNNPVFFTCMIFQESQFKNIANSSGYFGLGQMGNPAIADARQEINNDSRTKQKYQNYMGQLKRKDCAEYNSENFMPDISQNQLKQSIQSCPDLGVAASAVYINIIQEDIKNVIGNQQTLDNFDYYELTAIGYNAGRSVLRELLRDGLNKGKSVREIINQAHSYKNKNGQPAFSKNKQEEIQNYRHSIRHCMEKGNYNPKCGSGNWQAIRKRSLRCFKQKNSKGLSIDNKKSQIPCP